MEVKFEIVATEIGCTTKCFVDGVEIYEKTMKLPDGESFYRGVLHGTKKDNFPDEVFEGTEYQGLADDMSNADSVATNAVSWCANNA